MFSKKGENVSFFCVYRKCQGEVEAVEVNPIIWTIIKKLIKQLLRIDF